VEAETVAGRCSGVRSTVAVAVVSPDDLLVQRIRDGLARDGITIAERVSDAGDLSDRAADSIAIVLAGYTSASAQRAAIRTATTRFPTVPAVLVASVSLNGVRKALDAGASGVLLAPEIEAAIPETVRAAAAHLTVVPQRFRHDATRPPLSHREKETLALVARGLTNREIATQLYLAESTIKTHLASIFGKLGVGSRSEATALVLDPEDSLGLGLDVLARTS
jgi:DNA-binding NarL/FixJ family response regulator